MKLRCVQLGFRTDNFRIVFFLVMSNDCILSHGRDEAVEKNCVGTSIIQLCMDGARYPYIVNHGETDKLYRNQLSFPLDN